MALPVFAVLIALLGTNGRVAAQTPPANIYGRVQSMDGSPLPGTTVVAAPVASGRRHATHTDARGEFHISDLAAGLYELRVSLVGFRSRSEPPVELAPGQSLARDFVLESEAEGAKGAETAEKSPPEPEPAGVAGARAAAGAARINERQLAGLPLNGRSYSQLATLEAGITDPSAASGSRGVSGGGLTVSGGRSSSNLFLLDGTNMTDLGGGAPSSAAGVQLGSDALYQVQVFANRYGAEYGLNSGGVLNSITRSGGDQFHGTFFEFLRNSKLDARNFFDYDPQNPFKRSEPPPFKRNQFGFTLSGPILKEKTFFMASYEGLRDRLSTTDLSYFPDERARRGEITDESGRLVRFPVDPLVKPYLDLYPIPNDIRLSRGVGRNFAPVFLPTDENFLTARVDQKISDRDSLFVRYTADRATSQNEGATYLFKTESKSRQQYLTVAGSHIFDLSMIAAYQFGYTRSVSRTDNISLIDVPPSLFFVPGATRFGQIQVPGISALGPGANIPSAQEMDSFQVANDLVVQKGAHALKFGFQVQRYRWDVFSSWNEGGVWSFNSLENFLSAGGKPGTSLMVAIPGSDNRHDFRQTYAGFYVQDEYDVNPGLQLSLGLRYELATKFADRLNRIVFLPDLVRDTEVQIGSFTKDNPSLRSFAPRIGITWAPWSSRSTLFSWGFGIYYDQVVGKVATQRKSSYPFYNIGVNPNFDAGNIFPRALEAVEGIPFQVQVLDYLHMRTPAVYRYNFSIQQELAGGWRVQAAYVGARGNHLIRRYEANLYPVLETRPDGSLFFPPDSGPINPAFGAISMISGDAQSFYNGLQVSANKRLSQGLSMQANYTFSKSVDDNSTGPNGNFGQYPLMRTLDRGLSDFDIRHRLALSYFYTLPFQGGHGRWTSGLLSTLLGRWRVGGIANFRSGVPFTPTVSLRYEGHLFEASRPNLAPGRAKNPVGGVSSGCGRIAPGEKLAAPDLYFDPCAFEAPPPGTMGNLGRNTVIAPSIYSFDISLQKEFVLDGRRSLQFRADIFNLPNHTNFGGSRGSSIVIFSGQSGGVARRGATAGRIGTTATTSRQIQFALRFSF
ncbi:MAG: TonB-dependent receptor [Acidobacteria bacterium]|nr:TonB-dependent receptor [Acidobacteriota bacterium]